MDSRRPARSRPGGPSRAGRRWTWSRAWCGWSVPRTLTCGPHLRDPGVRGVEVRSGPMDDQELLRTVPIFSELSDEDIAKLAQLSSRRRYPKDTVVFFENEEGDFFFTIVDGRIKVTILGDDGREVILSILGPGDFFGEMALLDNEPRSATAIAIEDTELLSVHRTDFQT